MDNIKELSSLKIAFSTVTLINLMFSIIILKLDKNSSITLLFNIIVSIIVQLLILKVEFLSISMLKAKIE